ncbi:MAG: hypothetical protein ACM3Q9_01950 [Methanosarcina sp.]
MGEWQEAYPAVHRALAPQYRSLPREQVEGILAGTFGEGFGLDEAEGFFDDIGRTLGNVARSAAPVLQRALPGIVSGAAGGAALGPFGALGGALLGGLGGALGGGGAAAPRPPAGRPAAPAPAGGAGPSGAISQLLAVLGSPTTQQALSSMMLGRAGSPTVGTPTGSQLPVAAITNLLGMLAGRASAEWEALVPSVEAEGAGEAFASAAPEARAEWVLSQLAPIEAEPEDAGEASGGEASEEAWIDELYDELEAELIEGEAETWSLAADG